MTIAACFGQAGWLFELCSHFRIQFLIVNILLLLLALFKKRFVIAVIAAFSACVNFVEVFNTDSGGFVVSPNVGPSIRALLFNLNSTNYRLDAVREFIKDSNPDVIVILELSETAIRILALQDLGYLYSVEKKFRDDKFGIGLYSKHKVLDSKIMTFGGLVPSIVATIDFDANPTMIVGSHPLPPISPKYYQARNRQLQELGSFIASQDILSKIVMMDMNTTPWSFVFDDFKTASGLRDSRNGFGIQSTWPTWIPLLWIPIDHVFVSESVKVVSRSVGPFLGSDHYPVIVDLIVEK